MVILGSDHGGFALKGIIREFLSKKGFELEDVGVFSEESCDYPDIAVEVSKRVAQKEGSVGILICGTGIGMSIAANKIKGIRCALCHDAYTAEFARRHNNANVLAFGGRTTGVEIAKQMVDIFLSTPFDGGRHERRVKKIEALEVL